MVQRQQLFGVLVVLVILVGVVLFFRGGDSVEEELDFEREKVSVEEVVDELSSRLGVSVAEDVERITLSDVGGEGATGIATRDFSDGKFTHTVLAALPDLVSEAYYGGWLVRGSKGNDDYSLVVTGKFRRSKGGYLLEYSSTEDLSDHVNVWVTLESEEDMDPETRVLEGQF